MQFSSVNPTTGVRYKLGSSAAEVDYSASADTESREPAAIHKTAYSFPYLVLRIVHTSEYRVVDPSRDARCG